MLGNWGNPTRYGGVFTQAAHVVSALKQLGASDRLRKELTVIDESLSAAITILGHKVEGVELKCDLNCSRPFAANQGEMIQIWSNSLATPARR